MIDKLNKRLARLEQARLRTASAGCSWCAFRTGTGKILHIPPGTTPYHYATEEELLIILEAADRAQPVEVKQHCEQCGRQWFEQAYEFNPADSELVTVTQASIWERAEIEMKVSERK